MELTIQELLYNRGLPKEAKVKLVRHKDKRRYDLYEQYKFDKAAFLDYQKEQSKPVFDDCDYIVSFLGEEGTKARFIGVFRVNGIESQSPTHYYYDLSEAEGFEDIKERVIIEWGASTIKWYQWTSPNTQLKRIVEIQPVNFHNKAFTDYLDFILDFSELSTMVTNKYHYKDWYQMLSAVAGIYLILDKSTGNKYIGSAYGTEGIWGRWDCYVKTGGHGNNLKLKALMDNDKNYQKHFQFTLLMTLPKTMTKEEVIKRETLFKQKLGTQSFGLNLN
jgi:hypothetical protein